MPTLTINFRKCNRCMECETVLPSFMVRHNGHLFISWARVRDSMAVKASIDSVISCCPEHAITLDPA